MKSFLRELAQAIVVIFVWRVCAEWAAYFLERDGDELMLSVVAGTLAVHLVAHARSERAEEGRRK